MDNLDRTNVVQSVLARRAALNQLRATAGADASALKDAGECSHLASQRASLAVLGEACSRKAFDIRLLLSHLCGDFF